MKIAAQINISSTKENVWKTITDVQHFPKILKGVENIEILEKPANGLIGLKWKETRMYFGKPAAIDKWITESYTFESYKTRAELDSFIFITTLTISEDGGCLRLTNIHETIPIGILAKIKSIPMIFFKNILKKTIKEDLSDLKNAVEQSD